jgi:hypothetical protein
MKNHFDFPSQDATTRLISEAASSVLLVADGPQIPAGPVSDVKFAIRSLLRSRRCRKESGRGDSVKLSPPGQDEPLSSHSGGIDAPPVVPICAGESTSLSFRLFGSAPAYPGNRNILVENIEYSTIHVHTEQAE